MQGPAIFIDLTLEDQVSEQEFTENVLEIDTNNS